MATPAWRRLVDHVMAVPERIYEHWTASDGWDNDTQFGKEYGENRVSWCVIFDWDMYYDVGLQAVVPRVDNVTAFSDWAKDHHQWSEYPSIGAWVNLGNGQHTELVIGFDADTVYTKGGNSLQAGAVDNGQGNGVWSHATARTSPRVVGYFAPHFPDGVCPPTADPHDPRGGTAVASWRWTSAAAPTSTEDDMATAEETWAYKNTKAGDKHDMHQALNNAEAAAANALAQSRANGSSISTLSAKVDKLIAAGPAQIDYAKLAAALLAAVKES